MEELYIAEPKATCHITRQASITRHDSVPNLNSQASSPIDEKWKPLYHNRKQKIERHKLKSATGYVSKMAVNGIRTYARTNQRHTLA